MSHHTRIHDKFAYHAEDLDCHDCLHQKHEGKRMNQPPRMRGEPVQVRGHPPRGHRERQDQKEAGAFQMPGVSRDQIDRAKQVDILDYLLRHEPGNLTCSGKAYYYFGN